MKIAIDYIKTIIYIDIHKPSNSAKGKKDYEMDCKLNPKYHDGTIRKSWDQLSDIAKWSWNRPENRKAKGE